MEQYVDLGDICGLDESFGIFDGPLALLEDVGPGINLSVLDNAPDLLGNSTEFPDDFDFQNFDYSRFQLSE